MSPGPHVAPASRFAPLEVRPADRVFVLTGAGISAESGVRTFRDAGGLWEDHRVEDVATPEAWARDPQLVWRFYSERRRQLGEVRPNPAHLALAALEHISTLFLCTQNVDDLHERGGSRAVCHMHGELLSTRCERCDRPALRDRALYFAELPRCPCGARLRPDIVWFGEVPMHLPRIADELAQCDLFLTIGSSGAVYPAAGLVAQVRQNPSALTGRFARTIYIGPEAPENARAFDECRLGRAGEVLPALFRAAT